MIFGCERMTFSRLEQLLSFVFLWIEIPGEGSLQCTCSLGDGLRKCVAAAFLAMLENLALIEDHLVIEVAARALWMGASGFEKNNVWSSLTDAVN